MKTTIQTTQETGKGVRLVIPTLPIDSEKARLRILSLESTKHLIDLDIADFPEDERVRLHLENAKMEMTQALYYAEGAR